MKVIVVVGTRPEAIKLAPVIRELGSTSELQPVLVSTGQHRELLDQAFGLLSLVPDHELQVMSERQRLADLTARLVGQIGQVVRAEQPGAVLVQGDTTTCLCGALAAFYEGVPVGHVEAGLRSGTLDNPFPEEANRSMVARITRWHFAPTSRAVANLRAEGIPADGIELTGNTVVDSLRWIMCQGTGRSAFLPGYGRRKILVTLHRRESHGHSLRGLSRAIAVLADRPSADIVVPLHRSPAVREALVPALAGHPAVRLMEPLDYHGFVATSPPADLFGDGHAARRIVARLLQDLPTTAPPGLRPRGN